MDVSDRSIKCTFIFTYFGSSPDYAKNLVKTIKNIQYQASEIIVVEQPGPYPLKDHMTEALDYCHIVYKSAFNGENIYFRTQAINRGLKACGTEIAFVCDCDAICPPLQIDLAIQAIKDGFTLVYPYDFSTETNSDPSSNSSWLTQYTLNETAELFFGGLTSIEIRQDETYTNLGLIFGVHVKRYLSYGGENPFFIDWGFEDIERFERVKKLSGTSCRISGPCYHLKHERRSPAARFKKQNFLELLKIKEMSASELADYVYYWTSTLSPLENNEK